MKTVEGYISRLDTPGGKIDLLGFKKFMDMMDSILVDEGGNLLPLEEAARAIDLSEVTDQDIEDLLSGND